MIVLDSSFIIAYHNDRDVHHAAASEIMGEILSGRWGRSLLLEYVFLEVVTVMLSRRGPATASAIASILLQAREVDFLPCSDFFIDTLDTFRNQFASHFSFTDAAIVTAARRQADTAVATFDREFKTVEGITVVPA